MANSKKMTTVVIDGVEYTMPSSNKKVLIAWLSVSGAMVASDAASPASGQATKSDSCGSTTSETSKVRTYPYTDTIGRVWVKPYDGAEYNRVKAENYAEYCRLFGKSKKSKDEARTMVYRKAGFIK